MASFWKRLISGLVSGGLSEFYYKWQKAKESADSPYTLTKMIEDEASSRGMSVEEFLAAYPEYSEDYNNAVFEKEHPINSQYHSNGSDSIGDALDYIKDKAGAYVDNATGERDVEENEKNRQFQAEEAEKNRQWEAEQAKAAREWDSIGAQMERAAVAGVNPISIAMQNGGINGSATTSIPSAPSTPVGSSGLMHNGAIDIAGAVFNGIGTLAENRLKQSQSDDIVIMRDYNIAEKMASVDHLRNLDSQIQLSNVAQSIQNRWLDVMNQVTYDGMLLQNGVSRETILEKRSLQKLNLAQIDSIRQSLDINLKTFNAKLPLELQLMQSELDLNRMSVQDVYTEICMRYLQSIEQENRNRQSAAEAGSAEVAEYIAKQTYEDAIASFHNDIVKSAADAGVALYDYMYYGNNYKGFFDWIGKTERGMFGNRMRRNKSINEVSSSIIIPQNLSVGQ